jgi:hypothetical protein
MDTYIGTNRKEASASKMLVGGTGIEPATSGL